MYQKHSKKRKQPSVKDTVVKAVSESKKKNKKAVDYSKGTAEAHCGICEYFISPDQCQKVKGDVSFDMWCELFENKKEDTTEEKDKD